MHANRFSQLRSASPAGSNSGSFRNRSLSVKRKNDDNLSYANAAKRNGASAPAANPEPPLDHAPVFSEIETTELNIAKARSICESVETALNQSNIDPAIISLFGDIIAILSLTIKSQESLCTASKLVASTRNPCQPLAQPSYARPPVALVTLNSSTRPSRSTIPQSAPAPPRERSPLSEEETAKLKFREAVKDAEKSTLVFNLDMGRVPIMNKSTMSRKATGSLLAKAATAEGSPGSIPSEDAVAAIDDLLSVTENMSFFGATTKTYRNPSDPDSAAFCTVPVKYTFRDKETRIRAENILRNTCKIQCSTPYPVVLRECIKQAVASGKIARPESFVRVNVDTANLCLKLAWRAKDESQWISYPTPIPLPAAALDTKLRKAPDNILLENLPPPPQRNSVGTENSNVEMSDAVDVVSGPSTRNNSKSTTKSLRGLATPKK